MPWPRVYACGLNRRIRRRARASGTYPHPRFLRTDRGARLATREALPRGSRLDPKNKRLRDEDEGTTRPVLTRGGSTLAGLLAASGTYDTILWIIAAVLVGLDQGWRASGVHQRRNPTPCRDAEISKPVVWQGLERRRAAGRDPMDAVPVRWRAALVCLFGHCKRGVLRSPGHQAVRRWTPVRLPSLLSACLR